MKIVVVEDELLIRELLIKIAGDVLACEVIGEATDGLSALNLCRENCPNLVLMDIMIPEINGLKLARLLIREFPHLRILALSSGHDEYTLHQLFKSGVHGYVDKLNSSIEILTEAIETVASGKVYFSKLAMDVKTAMQNDTLSFAKVLSDREVELMALFARGFSNIEIGEKLGLSHLTVQSHRRSVMRKLNLRSAKELMRYAIDKGFWRFQE